MRLHYRQSVVDLKKLYQLCWGLTVYIQTLHQATHEADMHNLEDNFECLRGPRLPLCLRRLLQYKRGLHPIVIGVVWPGGATCT